MSGRKKPTHSSLPPAYPLPDGVELTPAAQEDWTRLTRLLPLNTGPRVLFVLVDSLTLRRRLAEHLAAALRADGHSVAWLDFAAPYYQPLQQIFDVAAEQFGARFCFLLGLERSLIAANYRLSALTDLNLHRDQISQRLPCPLVIWTTDAAFTDLVRNAPDFIAWRSGVFTLADPFSAVADPYRQHIIGRFSKLMLYSATTDTPLAVDLERIFVKLTAAQRRRTVTSSATIPWESLGPAGEVRSASPTPLPVSLARTSLFPGREVPEEFTVTVSINEALNSGRCLAVIGAPGAGKTTLLRYLALTYARQQARERLDLSEERLPVFIVLRDFNRFLDDAEQRSESLDLSPQLLPRFLSSHTKAIAPHLSLPDDFFSGPLDAGKCIVLLDGLDEVADPAKRVRIVEVIAACTRHYQGNRFIVTSRPRGYDGEAKQRLASLYGECAIRDFDDGDMAAFARNWYEAVIRNRLGDTPEATAEAQRQADDLLRAIRADERVEALAPNPLLLSILAMVHQRGVGLPQQRAELYDECTDMLLGYWDQTKGGEAARELATLGELTRNEKRTLLQPIALWFHERGEQGLEAGKEELEREIARQFTETFGDTENKARYRAALFLRVIDERAGLLMERETGVYAFAHLTFQEYLAARAIADRDDYIEYTLQHLHDPWWREVILLEVGHLSDVRHFGRRARKLTSDLIRAIRNAGSWLEDVLKRDLLFATRCLCDTSKLGVDDDLRKSLLDELITLWHTTPYEPQRREVVDIFASAMPTIDGERIRTELLRCLDDKEGSMRLAAGALGRIGSTTATPATIERLLALTADQKINVRWTAARALGGMNIPVKLIEQLVEFWRHQLENENNRRRFVDGQFGPVHDIPYEELRRLVALRERKLQS